MSLIPNPSVNYSSPSATGSLSFAPVANANGSAVITVTVNDGGAANNTASVSFTVVVTPVDDPPTLDAISSLTINEDAGTQTVNLTGITSGASNESQTLVVTATSDNTGLIPNPGVNYSSPGAAGSLSFAPAPNANGSANISVSVSDGSNTTATRSFTVTVTPVNDPPTVNSLSNLTINEDAGTQTVGLSGISSGASNESQTLVVTATSDNTGLIPNPSVSYTSPNTTGSLGFAPVSNANGAATITVTVNDGASPNSTASTTFTVTVAPVNDPATISDIPNQAVDQGSSLSPVAFAVNDIDNQAASLTVSAKSSDQNLVPDGAISLGGSGVNRTIAIQPASGQSGVATISVSVSDGSASATDTFVFTVNRKGSPPTIVNHPASQTVDEGADVVLKVDAAGDPPLAFQWRFNQRALPGETGAALLLPAVQASRAGNYDVVVSNQNGAVISNPARLTVQLIQFDFGDVPDPTFPTTLKNNGARHRIVKDVFLGKLIDAEPDGKPSADALGDDGASPTVLDDEDGVRFLTPLNAGETVKIEVVASVSGRLDAWLDFNGNGSWVETNERVFAGQSLVPGVNTISFNVPAGAKGGDTFARFRFSREGVKSFDGSAPDGEVEDYRVAISAQLFDFGDAPEFPAGLAVSGYPTTLSRNGARHVIDPKFVLGKLIDGEPDGQPSLDALGAAAASTAVPDDEDGVIFSGALNTGTTATVIVTASQSGRLDAWMDFNANFSWADAGEKIFTSQALVAGANTLTFPVPASAKAVETYARFRFSREGGLSFDGLAPVGEVEDYKVTISGSLLDFGDAPQLQSDMLAGGYPTTLSRNGARHAIDPKFVLGKLIDGEPDGKPGSDALGDDGASSSISDDEDGVVFPGPLNSGAIATVVVTASQSGRLDAWVDFNANFSWADAGEKIFTSQALVAGANTLTFPVPASAKAGETYARFRFSREGGLNFDGLAPIGEVEDYKVAISGQLLDFGDAPQLLSDLLSGGYPTTLSRNGARHGINPNFFLGKLIDGELDGQPDPAALGDDGVDPALDDEDGVRFLTPLMPGGEASIEVIASTTGRLDAWIDFNANFSWADPEDRIFTNQALVPGVNVLKFMVPLRVKPGVTFARFRFSREGGLDFTGFSPIGEVEDYRVEIERGENCDLTCAGTDFWLTFPGNYAPDPANPVRPELSVVGNPGTSVTVQIAGLKFQKAVTIPAVGCVTILLPEDADLGDANDLIEKKGIHLIASQPVSVHGLSKVKYTSDGFLAIQTEALGLDYIIQSFSNSNSPQPELNGTQFALVATENDTTVTIIPSVVTQGYDSGFPYVIKLQQGETYQLRNLNGPPQDLSGTLISADKPVAAFGGHACANIQSTSRSFCDYLVEQLIPTKRWGTEYFTFPLKTRSKGDTIRVLAAADDTQVFINGFNVATLDRGRMFQIVLGFGVRITANGPIHVTQYANSSDFDLVKQSDPFMMQLPHRALFNTQYRFCAPESGFASHFINVIAPSATASAGLVQMDGAPIPPGFFSAIGLSGFSGASVPVTPGVHSVLSPQPVGLTQYGWSDYESYGWPVCFSFGDTTPPVVKCPDSITVDLNKTPLSVGGVPCKTPVPDLRQKVTYTDNCPQSSAAGTAGIASVNQEPPPGTLVGPGQHDIVLSVTDGRGNTGSCVTKFIVIGPPPDPNAKPVVHCPQDIVVPCIDDNGAFVDFKAFVSIGCEELPMECNPPPGLFPVGKTQVTCVYKGSSTPLICSFSVTVNCAKISLTPVGNTLTISWPPSQKLQVSDSLLGPWTDVPAGAPTLNVNTGDGSQKFYRIRP